MSHVPRRSGFSPKLLSVSLGLPSCSAHVHSNLLSVCLRACAGTQPLSLFPWISPIHSNEYMLIVKGHGSSLGWVTPLRLTQLDSLPRFASAWQSVDTQLASGICGESLMCCLSWFVLLTRFINLETTEFSLHLYRHDVL